jgi:hypothetical protein
MTGLPAYDCGGSLTTEAPRNAGLDPRARDLTTPARAWRWPVSHPALPLPLPDLDPPDQLGELITGPWPELEPIVEPEPVALDCPLEDMPPAPACSCGNVTDQGHNGFTCDEVNAIRARVERYARIGGGRASRRRLAAMLRGAP